MYTMYVCVYFYIYTYTYTCSAAAKESGSGVPPHRRVQGLDASAWGLVLRYVYMYIHMCVYFLFLLLKSFSLSIYIYTYICIVQVCMYTHMYIYIYIYTYICNICFKCAHSSYFLQRFAANIDRAESRRFRDDPVCPDPVRKLSTPETPTVPPPYLFMLMCVLDIIFFWSGDFFVTVPCDVCCNISLDEGCVHKVVCLMFREP